MFGFKKKDKDFALVLGERKNYLAIFEILIGLLKKSENFGQAKIIENLVILIQREDWQLFDKLINGVNMWGGSGAVWEVNIQDEAEYKKFQREIIHLINLMERTKILGNGVKRIRKLFE